MNPRAENEQGASPATRFITDPSRPHAESGRDIQNSFFLQIPGWMLDFSSLHQCDYGLRTENTLLSALLWEVSSQGQKRTEAERENQQFMLAHVKLSKPLLRLLGMSL